MNILIKIFSIWRKYRLVALIMVLLNVTGCDLINNFTQDKTLIKKTNESKAVGAGCRQANVAIEDCFSKYEKEIKSSMLEGWKEMDSYMRENTMVGNELKK